MRMTLAGNPERELQRTCEFAKKARSFTIPAGSSSSRRRVTRRRRKPATCSAASRTGSASKGQAARVEGAAVELDHEALRSPDEVDLVARHDDVDLGLREACLAAEVEEVPLEVRARAGRLVERLTEDGAERLDAPPAMVSHARGLDLSEIEQVSPLGLLDRPLELPVPGGLGEVEERPGDGGEGDVVEDGDIVGLKMPDPMEPDAVPWMPASIGDGHVDDRARGRPQVPVTDRGAMADRGLGTVRERRGHVKEPRSAMPEGWRGEARRGVTSVTNL